MHRNGSALIYVIIVVFAITSVVIVSAKLASSTQHAFDNLYEAAQFKSLSDGVIAEATAEAHKGTLVNGDRVTAYSVGSVTTQVSPSSTVPRALNLKVMATINGKAFERTTLIGNRAKPHPLFYGIWSSADHLDNGFATSIDGSLYVGGNATFAGALTAQGDVLVRGSSTMTTPEVSGHVISGARLQTVPSLPTAEYSSLATVVGSNRTSDITFGAPDAGGSYPLMMRTGNYTLNGGIVSGRGTIYVTGNLVIDGNYNYADADSRVLFIVGGNLRVQATCTNLVGSFLSTGQANIQSAGLSVLRGNIGTGSQVNRSGTINLVQDMAFLDFPAEALKHRTPGLWIP